jgi:hypothetical protein
MSVTGSGTSSDPYVIETYDELKEKVEGATSDVYIKFVDGTKIDLSQVYPGETPYITCKTANNISIDGNGAKLSGFSNSERSMFENSGNATTNKFFELKNITIDSIYTPHNEFIFVKMIPRLDHVKIAGNTGYKYAFSFKDPYYDAIKGWIKQSTFTMSKNTYDAPDNVGMLCVFASVENNKSWPDDMGGSGKNALAGVSITDNIFDITSLVKVAFVASCGGNWNDKKTIFSRNTIKLNKLTPVYSIWESNDDNVIDMSNNVIRGNSEGVINLPARGSNFTGVTIVDGTNLPNVVLSGSPTPFRILTVEEMKNPAYLQSIGFECA